MFQIFKFLFSSKGAFILVGVIGVGLIVWIFGKTPKTKSRQKDKPELYPDPKDSPQAPDREVCELARQLAKLDQELEWMEQLDGYSKVFHGLLEPLQALLGCARTLKVSGLNDVQRTFFLQEKVLKPLASSARRFRQLPEIKETGVLTEADWKEYLVLTPDVLRGKIQERKRRVNVKSYLRRDWELLLELEKAGLFRLAEEADRTRDDELVSAGGKIDALLCKYGIYALYKDDERLANMPALQESFNEGNSSTTACPGLFLLRDGKYELFAAHNGIWV